ncbi:MAG: Uma2 family endonuclease [Cyanobacteria bacterium P01_A01_bin.135]
MTISIPIHHIQVPPGQSVLLQVTWQEFDAILRTRGDRPASRLAYADGTLEIMTPLPEHEYFKETLGDAIKDIAETLNLDYESYGSTTWRLRAKQAGLEADNCFYFQNEARVRGRLALTLPQDPPPDLALEIDLTSKSLDRFPIYARLGVPEIWCYDAGRLTIFCLRNGDYTAADRSLVFPTLPVQALPTLIEANRSAGRLALRRAIRQWVGQQS